MNISGISGSTPPLFQDNGIVKYGPLETEAAVEYLTMMNNWWNEGLIYADFLSVFAPFAADTGPILQDKVGIAVIVGGMLDSLSEMSTDPDFQLWPIADAVKEAGTTHDFATAQSVIGMNSGFSTSTECRNVRLMPQQRLWSSL